MNVAELFFYLFSIVMVASAFMVISARNPVHSVLFLILTLRGVGLDGRRAQDEDDEPIDAAAPGDEAADAPASDAPATDDPRSPQG